MGAYTGEDMKEAIKMRGRRIAIAAVTSPVYIHASLFVWRARVVLFCVARVCCALLSAAHASARPGSAPAGKPPAKRLGKLTYAFLTHHIYDLYMIFIHI